MSILKLKSHTYITLLLASSLFLADHASAAITFVSGTNSANLVETVDDNGNSVFVIDGIADGDSTDLTFTTDSECPGVAMVGGAEFASNWSCEAGTITASVTYRGGMSFGPGPEEITSFYITFSDPPAPPGSDTVPTELSGIQIAVFGDVSQWDLSGGTTSAGATFGVELSGPKGGDAHFRMDLPQAAADYLGGVLGVFVGGKADPFATVDTNEDGSVSIKVDIASLSSTSSASVSSVGAKATTTVTKKITTGARSLSIGFNKTSVKSGKSVGIALCTGSTFTAGDKIPVKFTVGGRSSSLKKTLTVGSDGCVKSSLTLKSVSKGTLTAKVSYKGRKASGTVKVTK